MTNEKYSQYYIEYLQSALQEVILSRISLQANAKMIDEAAGNLLNENQQLNEKINDLNNQIEHLKGELIYKQYDVDAANRLHEEAIQTIQSRNIEIESLRRDVVQEVKMPVKVPPNKKITKLAPIEPEGEMLADDGGTF